MMITREDYKVMEVKVNNEWVKRDVLKRLKDGTCIYLVGDKLTNGSYMQGGAVAGGSYREIPTSPEMVEIVKPKDDLLQALKDKGYTLNGWGNWQCKGYHTVVIPMFKYCGKEPKEYCWEPFMLTKVPVIDMVDGVYVNPNEPKVSAKREPAKSARVEIKEVFPSSYSAKEVLNKLLGKSPSGIKVISLEDLGERSILDFMSLLK